MKGKLAVCLLAVAGVLASATSLGNTAAKADSPDAADLCFLDFIASDAGDETISYEHSPLYDETLTESGRQYDFSFGTMSGYALLAQVLVGDSLFYEVEELLYGVESPFDDCEGLPVYISHKVYLDYKNGGFYDLSDGSLLSEAELEEAVESGFGYTSGNEDDINTYETKTQTVTYASKLPKESYSIPYDLPNYGSMANASNCANTAGAVLIGYYDRFCENLIPNYTPYIMIGPALCYRNASEEVESVAASLYSYMGTDVGQAGTTYTGFQNGMQRYVTEHGYTYTTESLFTYNMFNYTLYKAAIDAQKPVVLFLSGYACLNSIQTNEAQTVDTISSGYKDSLHVMVGCGYKRDVYYDADGNTITTRTYLKVSTGLTSYNIGYLNINGYGNIDRALSVTIS